MATRGQGDEPEVKKSRQKPEVKCENVLMTCVLGFYKRERVPGPELSAASLNKSSKSNG